MKVLAAGTVVLVPCHQQHRNINGGERRRGLVAQHAQHPPGEDGG